MSGPPTPRPAASSPSSSATWTGTPRWARSPAVSDAARTSRGCSSAPMTCCCSTSPQTTSTWAPSPGWQATFAIAGRGAAAPCSSSRTTAGFSTRRARACGRSTTAWWSPLRAATPHTSSSGPSASAWPRQARSAARTSCARSSHGSHAAPRRARASRSSASRRHARSWQTCLP